MKVRAFGLTAKILSLFLLLSLISLVIIGLVAFNQIQEVGRYALETSSSLGNDAVNNSTKALTDLGEYVVKQKSKDVAQQLEIYIKSHRDLSVAQLQNDPEFQSIAEQMIGQTGYTVVLDVNNGTYYFHKNDAFENKKAELLFADPSSEYYNPQVWNLINHMVLTREDSGGYYDWKDTDGSIRPKYTWFSLVKTITADGKQLFVAATVYIDEFSRPAIDATYKINSAISASTDYIQVKENTVRSTFIGIFFAVLLVVSGLSIWLARTISKPIVSLTAAAAAMERGELKEEEINRLGLNQGKDEVAALSRVFAKMAAEVKARENRLKKQVEDLKIEIDHTKQARQVAEITDTDYFQTLKQKAKDLREKKG